MFYPAFFCRAIAFAAGFAPASLPFLPAMGSSISVWPATRLRPFFVEGAVRFSKAAFDDYCTDPKIAHLHPHREKGAGDYIWHLFDKLEDLRPILK
jgi:hypothetical protein